MIQDFLSHCIFDLMTRLILHIADEVEIAGTYEKLNGTKGGVMTFTSAC